MLILMLTALLILGIGTAISYGTRSSRSKRMRQEALRRYSQDIDAD